MAYALFRSRDHSASPLGLAISLSTALGPGNILLFGARPRREPSIWLPGWCTRLLAARIPSLLGRLVCHSWVQAVGAFAGKHLPLWRHSCSRRASRKEYRRRFGIEARQSASGTVANHGYDCRLFRQGTPRSAFALSGAPDLFPHTAVDPKSNSICLGWIDRSPSGCHEPHAAFVSALCLCVGPL